MARPPIPQKRRLSLRPEHQANSSVSQRSKKTISEIIKKTRNPFGEAIKLQPTEVYALEKTLRKLERELVERERSIEELEIKLSEKERELWETEALLNAKEQLVESRLKDAESVRAPSDAEERVALEALKAELTEQEKSLKEQRELLRDREDFLEQSESLLFEKTMTQQETQAELDQKLEEFKARERRFNESEGKPEEAAG